MIQMKTLRAALILGAILVPASLRAGVISGVITSATYSFAGGSTNQVNTAGLFVGVNYTEPGLIFNDNLPIDLQLTVNAAGRYDLNEAPGFGYVQNVSGTAWTGFKADIISGAAVFSTSPSDTYISNGSFPPALLSTAFSNGNATVTFSNGTVSSGAEIAPIFTFIAPAAGTYVFRQTPSVPEPSTMILAVLGAVAILAGRRIRTGRGA